MWKSHDDSIAQRTAIDHARHEKGSTNTSHHHHHGTDRRRGTTHEDSTGDKGKGTAS